MKWSLTGILEEADIEGSLLAHSTNQLREYIAEQEANIDAFDERVKRAKPIGKFVLGLLSPVETYETRIEVAKDLLNQKELLKRTGRLDYTI